jgi:anthranilate 3-monooxygenase (FAD)/4-hydroxyphenylacetate 3-monooxygenase
MASEDLKSDTELYYQGAGMASVDRVRLFKLAWDLAGDAFGTRLLQYERYYAGDPVRLLAGNYLSCNDHDLLALVNSALDLAGLPLPARSNNAFSSPDEPAGVSHENAFA